MSANIGSRSVLRQYDYKDDAFIAISVFRRMYCGGNRKPKAWCTLYNNSKLATENQDDFTFQVCGFQDNDPIICCPSYGNRTRPGNIAKEGKKCWLLSPVNNKLMMLLPVCEKIGNKEHGTRIIRSVIPQISYFFTKALYGGRPVFRIKKPTEILWTTDSFNYMVVLSISATLFSHIEIILDYRH